MSRSAPVLLRSSTRRRALRFLAVSALLLSAASRPASAAPAVRIDFEPSAVLATGLTPGGEALLFSISREPQTYFTRVERRDEVLPVGGAGEIRHQPFEDGSELPLQAVWVVVDLATGELAHATTPGFRAPGRALPADGVRRGAGGRWNRLAQELNEAQALVVRPVASVAPGEAPAPWGVWGAYWMDGSGFDLDGADDGALEAALDTLVPLAGSAPPPEELASGDLVVLVDPSTLAYVTGRLSF